MKKVLILAYDFPPYVSVGGLRPYSWYKYLHEYGVYPIVVTRQWENEYGNKLDYILESQHDEVIKEISEFGKIIRTPYKPNLSNRLLLQHGDERYIFVRKAITGYFEYAQFMGEIGPKVELLKAARTYLKHNKVDAIIATGDPFILFSYASKLGKEFNTPWIADYRDPWGQNINFKSKYLFSALNSFFERSIVKKAAAITTVSEFMVETIKKNVSHDVFHILPNGYDPELVASENEVPVSAESLQIAFVGTIYNWHPIESFLNTLYLFCKKNKDVNLQLNFYGLNKTPEIQDLIENKYSLLSEHVTFTPKLENDVLLKRIKSQHLMLLFNDYSILGTKIFDYLALRRKILLCYSNDAKAKELKQKYFTIEEFETIDNHLQASLIQETSSGIVVENEQHLSRVLQELYQEFQETGTIACTSHGIENYSRKIQVEKLAEIIKNL